MHGESRIERVGDYFGDRVEDSCNIIILLYRSFVHERGKFLGRFFEPTSTKHDSVQIEGPSNFFEAPSARSESRARKIWEAKI